MNPLEKILRFIEPTGRICFVMLIIAVTAFKLPSLLTEIGNAMNWDLDSTIISLMVIFGIIWYVLKQMSLFMNEMRLEKDVVSK